MKPCDAIDLLDEMSAKLTSAKVSEDGDLPENCFRPDAETLSGARLKP